MHLKKIYLLLFILFIGISFSYSQASYNVQLSVTEKDNDWLPSFKEETSYDSLYILSTIKTSIQNLRNNHYLLANTDSIIWKNNLCKVYLNLGEKYQLDRLIYDEASAQILKESGFSVIRFTNGGIDTNYIQLIFKRVLNYLNNNGYPFAKIELGNTTIDGATIQTELLIAKNDFVSYDSLKMFDNSPISNNFMTRYLNIRKNAPYNHRNILDIQRKVRDLGFVKLSQDPEVKFIKNKANISLPLVPSKSSDFDFLIGILPTNENSIRKINVVGELSTNLINRFGHGEQIAIQLRRLSAEDQLLKLKVSYPYLLKLPIGVDGLFELRRNRNLSIDLNSNIGGQYILNGLNFVRAFASYKTSRLINIDTSTIVLRNALPANLDYNYRGGGLEYSNNNLNYRLNPSRGWSISSEMNIGVRTIIKNQSILTLQSKDISFEEAYDSLTINSFQASFALNMETFIPIRSYGTIKLGINSGIRYNDGKVLENELYRIGGNRLLRGFDELSILTDYYAVLTSEFRLLLNTDSYLSFPFIDFSRMRTFVEGESVIDNAYGIGLGLNFSTKSGIFNISFAAGSRLQNPIDFNNTKVHFGYVNLF